MRATFSVRSFCGVQQDRNHRLRPAGRHAPGHPLCYFGDSDIPHQLVDTHTKTNSEVINSCDY